MQPLTDQLSELFGDAFAAAGYARDYGEVVPNNRPDLGDFQCNGALAAAGRYGKNPRALATEVVDALPSSEMLDEVEVAGPGFINIRVDDRFLADFVEEMAEDERLGVPLAPQGRRLVLDFGGPNAAKYMHVGHLRSSIIGDSLQRLLTFYGDEVISDVHLGDWGLQMGMLITEIERRHPDLAYFDPEAEGPFPEESPVTMDDLQEYYPAASARTKADPEAMEAAREATRQLQAGRPGYRALWQHIIDISDAELKQDFERLGVEFDLWLGESDAQPRIEPMIQQLRAEGEAVESEGALVMPVEREDDKTEIPPLMLLKSDGAVLYGTTDLATLAQRVERLEPDGLLYVTDARQSLHFEQVFRAARQAGLAPPTVDLEHLPFGTMNDPRGHPFKTRSGGVMMLRELMEMVEEKAAERLEEIEMAEAYGEEEKAEIAHRVALATLKFADLINHRARDYVFDLERFSAFEGRTGPYLLYTAVRAKSILRRAAEQGLQPGDLLPPAVAEERELMLYLTRLPGVVAFAYETRAPNHLADYVYNLALTFNRFYRACHIMTEEDRARQASWLALTQFAVDQMELVLDLLGIEVPERM
ncbi:MAG: arginine--tRNA ligase [Candidatus Promineifilaceae bacterium]|nr:arginine--tRNA ligase [Candidatus Promineifilaceae bacterium]